MNCPHGFYGMSVSANDLALRSYIPAKVIFSGAPLKSNVLDKVLGMGIYRPDTIPPAQELMPEFLHEEACDLFDRLYYAHLSGEFSKDEGGFLQYLAIRWVLLNKTYMYFLKLPTTNKQQLALQGGQWKKLADILDNSCKYLQKTVGDINTLIFALNSAKMKRPPNIMLGDCRENIKNIDWNIPSFVLLNPPTAGNSVFMKSNRVLDTLIHGKPQPLEDGTMPADLWKSLVLDSCTHIPSGQYVFSFVGDGAVSWEEGYETVFKKIGDIITEWTFPWHGNEDKKAGLILMRRS